MEAGGEQPPDLSVALRQEFLSRERKEPCTWRDYTELQVMLSLARPEPGGLFLGDFQSHFEIWPLAWEASALVSAFKGLEGATGRLGDSREAGYGDGSAPTPT